MGTRDLHGPGIRRTRDRWGGRIATSDFLVQGRPELRARGSLATTRGYHPGVQRGNHRVDGFPDRVTMGA